MTFVGSGSVKLIVVALVGPEHGVIPASHTLTLYVPALACFDKPLVLSPQITDGTFGASGELRANVP